MSIVNAVLRDLKRERITTHYSSKGRYISSKDYHELKAKKRCKLCKKKLKGKRPEIDHIIPISKGGTNERKNLQAICHACHQKKTEEDNHGNNV